MYVYVYIYIYIQLLVDMLESRMASREEECCVCLEPIDPTSAVITKCQHIFCSPCLMRCLHMDAEAHSSEEREREETPGDGRCPLCRRVPRFLALLVQKYKY
jgi:hypothetical protein